MRDEEGGQVPGADQIGCLRLQACNDNAQRDEDKGDWHKQPGLLKRVPGGQNSDAKGRQRIARTGNGAGPQLNGDGEVERGGDDRPPTERARPLGERERQAGGNGQGTKRHRPHQPGMAKALPHPAPAGREVLVEEWANQERGAHAEQDQVQ